MAIIAILLIASLLIANKPWNTGTIRWQKSFEQGLALAKQNHRLVFVDFYAEWCVPCKEMDRTTFRNPEVAKALAGAIAIRVDIDERKDLAARYPSPGLPYICVLDSNGNLLKSFMGEMDAEQFLAFWNGSPQGAPTHHGLFF